MKRLILNILCICILCSCTDSLKPNDYIKWFDKPENGYVQEYMKDSGLVFEFTYRPAKYMALVALRGESIDYDKIEKMRKEYDSSFYLQLNIKELNPNLIKKNTPIYYEKIEYLASYIKNDLKLVISGDTIPCSLHHFERNYGISPANKILLVFDKKGYKSLENATLLFDDSFFHHELIQIQFNHLAQEPNIKISKS